LRPPLRASLLAGQIGLREASPGFAGRGRRRPNGRAFAGQLIASQARLAPRLDRKWRSRPLSRVLSWTTIPLGLASPQGSSSTPGCGPSQPIAPLFGLAPSGVYRAVRRWPRTRWALTPPFHPYHARSPYLDDLNDAACAASLSPSRGDRRSAVCSLLHWPSARAAQALPGTLLCGARTFLGAGKLRRGCLDRLRRGHCRMTGAPRSRGPGGPGIMFSRAAAQCRTARSAACAGRPLPASPSRSLPARRRPAARPPRAI